ncbi:unnamed protein product [Mucor hiemalis]
MPPKRTSNSASSEATSPVSGGNISTNTDGRNLNSTTGEEINISDMEGIEESIPITSPKSTTISDAQLHTIVPNDLDFDFDEEIKAQIKKSQNVIRHYNIQIVSGLLSKKQVEHALSIVEQRGLVGS